MRYEIQDVSFGAFNTRHEAGHTRLDFTIVDPQQDRHKLEALLESRPDLWRELAYRKLTFGRPGEIKLFLARGTQGGMVKEWDKVAQEEIPGRVPIDVLGLVDRRRTEEILRQRAEFKPIKEPEKVFLEPGMVKHYVVRAEPTDSKLLAAYYLEIDHWLEYERKTYIGGLSFLLYKPYDPFRVDRPKSVPPKTR